MKQMKHWIVCIGGQTGVKVQADDKASAINIAMTWLKFVGEALTGEASCREASCRRLA